MKSNRLLPYQFGIGGTADGTRIEQALIALAEICDDVPADLVGRRWLPSPLIAGFTPCKLDSTDPKGGAPFLSDTQSLIVDGKYLETNTTRAKSIGADGDMQRTWEVSLLSSRPMIIGAMSMLAQAQPVTFACTVGDLPLAGDTAQLTIAGVLHFFVAVDGDTSHIATGLANKINTDVDSYYTASTSGPIIYLVAKVWNPSLSVVGAFVNGGGGAGTMTVVAGDMQNHWQYGATPPAGHASLAGTEDFTLQLCVSDGWDLENRKKLRQEALVYKMRSDAFQFSPVAPGVDKGKPAAPVVAGASRLWTGFNVTEDALVLVPAGARVFFMWTITQYANSDIASWGHYPKSGNAWNLSALCFEATR